MNKIKSQSHKKSLVTKSKNLKIEIIRHSLAHILACAVQELYPGTKFGIGPAIEQGFYYDFDFNAELRGKIRGTTRTKQTKSPRESASSLRESAIGPEDLLRIEKKMLEIIKKDLKFEKKEISIKEAKNLFKDQPYKLELIEKLFEKKTTIYQTSYFIDLCKGPHIKSTKEISTDSFKLTKVAGAYWKGDEKNPMLTRIYGIAFENKKELDTYLFQQEEAGKRDHKKIGKELDLFSFHPEAPGACFWHPKGMIIWNELETFGKNLRKKYCYEEVQTPFLAKQIFWETSGHWEHYKDSMFHFEIENEKYVIKPMDCPFNIKIYQEKQRSYKELPIRYTEIGRVMRNEKSGELNGLFRARHITQDDSHIFLIKDQIEKEIAILLKMAKEYFSCFKIEPKFYFSTRPKNFMGEIKDWNEAEKKLENALKHEKIKYEIKEKDGAFYGPKIDIDIKDALGRSWQLATIQLDFQLPQRFGIEYIDKNGEKKIPIMIHAAIFGSIERFMGILIEHFAGAFPLWLSPVQAIVIPVSEKFNNYGKKILEELKKAETRAEIDESNETLGKRIREAEMQKIPYLLVVGDKEMKNDSVCVRQRGKGDIGEIKIPKFLEQIKDEIEKKK